MIIRAWIVRTPEPHTVRLEFRFLAGELTVSMDEIVQISRSLVRTFGHTHEIFVDGVSYTLTWRLPQFRGRYVLLRTADIAQLPEIVPEQLNPLGLAIFSLSVSAACFYAAYHVRAIMEPLGVGWQYEPFFMAGFVALSIVFFCGCIRAAYDWLKVSETEEDPAGDGPGDRGLKDEAGAPPRTGAKLRPLLADIAATAARWKGRIFGRRFVRGRASNSNS